MPFPVLISLSILCLIWLAVIFWFGWLWTGGEWREDKPWKVPTSFIVGSGFDSGFPPIGQAANTDQPPSDDRAILYRNAGGIDV